MSKASQRKGRGGELEAAKEADEFGLDTRVHGQWEALDITIEGYPYEVKRCENLSLRRAHDAFEAEARGLIARINRKQFTITLDYKDWLEDQAELKRLRLPNGTEG